MYHLLLNKDNQEVYEITSQRQNAIVRLIKYLDSTKLDQLSLMADIRIYLENMKVIRPQNKNAKNIIIEYVSRTSDSYHACFIIIISSLNTSVECLHRSILFRSNRCTYTESDVNSYHTLYSFTYICQLSDL